MTGAALSATGLRRTTPLATATLVLAANAPDVDIVTQAFGSYTALAWRRGLTHGVPALLLLPFLVTGVILAGDHVIRRRLHPGAPPASSRRILALAFLGVWSHPALDWLNTYGMRWWMPANGEWSYGDSLFIVDPWLWLLLGGPLAILHSNGRLSAAAWSLLAAALSMLVLGTGLAPPGARAVWVAGVLGWIGLRYSMGPDPDPAAGQKVVRWTLAAASAYVMCMVVGTGLSREVVRAEADALGISPVQEIMVGPVPANPFRGEVVLRLPGEYRTGSFAWFTSPRLRLDPRPLSSHPRDDIVRAAEMHPDMRDYLVWSRFPRFEVRPAHGGWEVVASDVRYQRGAVSSRLGGITVRLDENLRIEPRGP